MKKICEIDQVEFEAKRPDARFCSARCRQKAARAASVDPKTGEVVTVLEPPEVKVIKGVWKDKPYDREKNLAAFVKMGVAQVDWLPTGIADFDELTQIPKGRITQIEGRYGVGKTTLCLNMIKGMKGVRVLYIDSEASLNPNLLVDLKLDASKFSLYNESADFEDIAEVIRGAAKSGKYDVIIFDSMASVTTKSESEGDFTAKNIGQKAFLAHKLIHLIQMDLKRTNTAFVVINQTRDKIGGYFPETYTPGGNAVPFAASLMISLKTIKSWRFPDKPKNGLYQGHEIEATIIKSKVNTPWRTKKFKLYYPNPVPMSEQEVEMNDKEAF